VSPACPFGAPAPQLSAVFGIRRRDRGTLASGDATVSWQDTTWGALAVAVTATIAGAGACVQKPTPAVPGPAFSDRTSRARDWRLGPLYFDPEGADFTSWVIHFKNEVYRNWVVPQATLAGATGHVDIEFRVERDGSMSGLRRLRSSGSPVLDESAQNALNRSHFALLPRDYGAARVTMQVTFYYRETAE